MLTPNSTAPGVTLGNIPMETSAGTALNDFYFNSLRSVDMQLVRLLDELDALGLTENTIVMFHVRPR